MTATPAENDDRIVEKQIVWQDHAHRHGYRPTLSLITFLDGTQCLELDVFGRVTVVTYTFPFLERDRL